MIIVLSFSAMAYDGIQDINLGFNQNYAIDLANVFDRFESATVTSNGISAQTTKNGDDVLRDTSYATFGLFSFSDTIFLYIETKRQTTSFDVTITSNRGQTYTFLVDVTQHNSPPSVVGTPFSVLPIQHGMTYLGDITGNWTFNQFLTNFDEIRLSYTDYVTSQSVLLISNASTQDMTGCSDVSNGEITFSVCDYDAFGWVFEVTSNLTGTPSYDTPYRAGSQWRYFMNLSARNNDGITYHPQVLQIQHLDYKLWYPKVSSLVVHYPLDSMVYDTVTNRTPTIYEKLSMYGIPTTVDFTSNGADISGYILLSPTTTIGTSNIPIGSLFSSPFTVSLYTKPSQIKTSVLFSNYYNETSNRYVLFMSSTGDLRWRIGSVSASSGNTNLVSDRYYHIVTVWNGSTQQLYIDGVLQTNTTATSTFTDTQRLVIGTRQNLDTSQSFNGTIRDVMLWSSALNSSDVASLYTTFYNSNINNFQIQPIPNITMYGNSRVNLDIPTYIRENYDEVCLELHDLDEEHCINRYSNTPQSQAFSYIGNSPFDITLATNGLGFYDRFVPFNLAPTKNQRAFLSNNASPTIDIISNNVTSTHVENATLWVYNDQGTARGFDFTITIEQEPTNATIQQIATYTSPWYVIGTLPQSITIPHTSYFSNEHRFDISFINTTGQTINLWRSANDSGITTYQDAYYTVEILPTLNLNITGYQDSTVTLTVDAVDIYDNSIRNNVTIEITDIPIQPIQQIASYAPIILYGTNNTLVNQQDFFEYEYMFVIDFVNQSNSTKTIFRTFGGLCIACSYSDAYIDIRIEPSLALNVSSKNQHFTTTLVINASDVIANQIQNNVSVTFFGYGNQTPSPAPTYENTFDELWTVMLGDSQLFKYIIALFIIIGVISIGVAMFGQVGMSLGAVGIGIFAYMGLVFATFMGLLPWFVFLLLTIGAIAISIVLFGLGRRE